MFHLDLRDRDFCVMQVMIIADAVADPKYLQEVCDLLSFIYIVQDSGVGC
jgi:hypothetical protein